MGRAFPELQMDTFMIFGLAPAPFVLADAHGNVAIFERIGSPEQAEAFARSLTIEMGGSAGLVMPIMSGADMKATIIRDTLSLAKRIGEAVIDCRARSIEPAETVAALCNGLVIFTGKIVDVNRRTVSGFARGRLKITAFDDFNTQMEIDFQNENLIARVGEEALCTVPDLITLVSLEDGEAIGHGVPALWLARRSAGDAGAKRVEDAGGAGGGGTAGFLDTMSSSVRWRGICCRLSAAVNRSQAYPAHAKS